MDLRFVELGRHVWAPGEKRDYNERKRTTRGNEGNPWDQYVLKRHASTTTEQNQKLNANIDVEVEAFNLDALLADPQLARVVCATPSNQLE